MSSVTQKLGFCVICGSRVHTDENYFKTSDGYCHKGCITETPAYA